MPKSTQIPEVGDWVIVTYNGKFYGERLRVTHMWDNFGAVILNNALVLKADEFYIV